MPDDHRYKFIDRRIYSEKGRAELGRVDCNSTDLSIVVSRSKLVVVIDESHAVRSAITLVLKQSGIPVRGFDNPFEALSWYENNYSYVDIVFMDMELPRFDILECFECIREYDYTQQVALLSKNGAWADVEMLLKRGANRFFKKPLEYDAIASFVEGSLCSSSCAEAVPVYLS